MISNLSKRSVERSDLLIVSSIAIVNLFIHFIVNAKGGYGYFRDELYYLACAEHPALGYVDHPPFSVLLLTLSSSIFGKSIFALRLLPALAGAITVFLTGRIAKELGGKTFAQALAAVASCFSFIYLAMFGFYSMNSIDILVWALAFWIIIRIIKTRSRFLWLVLGLVLGIGLLNKISVLWLGAGLFIGLIITKERKWLLTWWPYICGVIVLVIFSPFLLWNLNHDMAHLEFMQNARELKYSSIKVSDFLVQQILINNPINFVLTILGLIYIFANKKAKEFQLLGILYLIPLLILIINQNSKAEYLAPAYSLLFAAGAVLFEILTEKSILKWFRVVYLVLIVGVGLVFIPFVLPILPVKQYLAYAEAIGMKPESNEGKQLAELPQFYADMFGWEEKAEAVALVYYQLTPEERLKCAIYADNYGRCAAIDFFGPKYGLPKSIGRHNNYWIWGPRDYTGEVMIILGGNLEDKQEIFETVEILGKSNCNYCMPYEDDLKVYLCRGLKYKLKDNWHTLKHYE